MKCCIGPNPALSDGADPRMPRLVCRRDAIATGEPDEVAVLDEEGER